MKKSDLTRINERLESLEFNSSDYETPIFILFVLFILLLFVCHLVCSSLSERIKYLEKHGNSNTETYCVEYYLENNYILGECESYRSKLESVNKND